MADFQPGELVEAITAGDQNVVSEMIAGGAPVDDVNDKGESALIEAVWQYNFELMNLLLESGADPNFQSAKGKRPLTAHPNMTGRMVKALVKAGADPTLESRHGSVIEEVAIYSTTRVLKALFKEGFELHVEGEKRTQLLGLMKLVKSSNLNLVLEKLGLDADSAEIESSKLKDRIKLWSKAADNDAFKELVTSLEFRLECSSKSWKRRKAVRNFVKAMDFSDDIDTAESTVQQLGQEILSQGCVLVANDILLDEKFNLLLFPTNDKYEVLTAIGTNGSNYGLDCFDLIRWLQETENENPFQLVAATHDGLTVFFTQPVSDAKKLAKRIVKFCPDSESETLAADLKSDRFFTFWWD